MGVYKCNKEDSDYIRIFLSEKEKEVIIIIQEGSNINRIFLNYEDSQKIANELNQLLMGDYKNE